MDTHEIKLECLRLATEALKGSTCNSAHIVNAARSFYDFAIGTVTVADVKSPGDETVARTH
jgi:hypothetical protein